MKDKLRIAIVADTFPPLKTSGAVQLNDLAQEFVRQGYLVTVLLPSGDIRGDWEVVDVVGVKVLRLRVPKTKNVGYVRRTLSELIMPFCMRGNFIKSPLNDECWNLVVWYAPSIFHGPFVNFLKNRSRCGSYLIIRDIFPEWALDLGLMKNGLVYQFFRAVARYQYSVADVIGVQTPGNLVYFEKWKRSTGRKVEVLQNWLGKPQNKMCSINVKETLLRQRRILVYAGNMGVAQGMDILLELAHILSARVDIGFLFVGRGSEVPELKRKAFEYDLDNILFIDEIDPCEIPALYQQCEVGLVSLDSRHKSHNIPGKFLTYMQAGLPVLANVNYGNDLAKIVRQENVGRVCDSNDIHELEILCLELLSQISNDDSLAERCENLFHREYSVEDKVNQICRSLSS